MLKEVESPRQVRGELHRRWFQDSESDLIVWSNSEDMIEGFQYCFGKSASERAITWNLGIGFVHERVDDGEGYPFKYKGTPILSPDGIFNAEVVANDFRERSVDLDPKIISFVLERLSEYREGDYGV